MINEEKPFYKLNWDNEFSVRFNIESPLTHIPNNIFSVELPEIDSLDLTEEDINKTLKLTLRSTVDGSVEHEIFNTLFNKQFNIDISLSNPNNISWRYNSCSLEKVGFSPLIDKKSRSNPFNYILYIKVRQIVYNGDKAIIEFGKKLDYDVDFNTPTEYIEQGV